MRKLKRKKDEEKNNLHKGTIRKEKKKKKMEERKNLDTSRRISKYITSSTSLLVSMDMTCFFDF